MVNIKKYKKEIFNDFLEKGFFVVYDGELYTLLNNEEIPIIKVKKSNELLSFILGYNYNEKRIEELKKINENNIKNYERIIKDMGKESLLNKED